MSRSTLSAARLRVRAILGSALAAALGLAPPFAAAQDFPTKPIRMITPYPPGGTTDILSRLLAPSLQASLGQPIVVEAKAGAGGNVGTDFVAKAPPDGYTLAMTASGPLAINVTLFKNLPYQPERDLTPIVHVASVPLVLVVHPSFPAKTAKAFVEHIRANPDKYSYASAGNGTPQHLSAELYKLITGSKINHVPYRGSGPAINDLLGGQVPISWESMIAVFPHVKGGGLRALAVTSTKRSPLLPDVPTMQESGVAGYESIAWYGLVGPANIPKPILARLNKEMVRALDQPETKKRLEDMGSTPVHGTPEQFGAWISAEIRKWGDVVKKSGATVD